MEYKICLLSKIFGTAKAGRSQKIDKVFDLDELEAHLKTPNGKKEIKKYLYDMEGLGLCYQEGENWLIVHPDQVNHKTAVRMTLANDILVEFDLIRNFPANLIREGFVKSGREILMKNMGL